MKELELHQQDKSNVSQSESRVITQKKKLASIKLIHEGHSLYKVDPNTLLAEKVILKKTKVVGKPGSVSEVDYDNKFFYTTALNERNAIWHFARALGIRKRDFDKWLKVKQIELSEING